MPLTSDYEYQLDQLLLGAVRMNGRFALTSDGLATHTVVPRFMVQPDSIILTMPMSVGAGSADGRIWIEAGTNQFTVHHPASAQARSYSYVVFRPDEHATP